MRHTTKNTHIVFHISNFIQFTDFFLLGKNPENLISGLFLVGFLFEKSHAPCPSTDFFLLGKNPEILISGLFLVGFLFEKRPCATRQKTRFFTKYNRNNDHQTKRIMD